MDGGGFLNQWVVWLITVVILALIEFATINLTTIWFVVSGIIALFASLFVNNYIVQFGIFVIFGVFLLITTRPFLTKILKQHVDKTNLDRIINNVGIVTEKISKNHDGEVKVDGKRWTAFADKSLKVGTSVRILEIKGVRLKVKEEK